jgi:hypothetical protein
MRLPLSSSLPSIADSDDGSLSRQLMLADTNAEYNRIAFNGYDNYTDISSPSPYSERDPLRSIDFHPQVKVRFIRARSNTMRSSFSDLMGSFMCSDSPVGADSTQMLKECSPHSDDEEFDRFYRTMQSPICSIPTQQSRSRRLSYDDDSSNLEGTFQVLQRPRSISCDNFFQ